MTVLLDENFPLGLLRRLHADGFAAEHIISLGWRGAPDTRICERLQDGQVLFLTDVAEDRTNEYGTFPSSPSLSLLRSHAHQ